MQREKLYNFHKTTYFLIALFVFKMGKVLSDGTLAVVKTDRIEFPFFQNNFNKLYYVDCRAFHAASSDVFCFSFDKAY
mgnify:CR=1 FL=1